MSGGRSVPATEIVTETPATAGLGANETLETVGTAATCNKNTPSTEPAAVVTVPGRPVPGQSTELKVYRLEYPL